jgi:hypothetical protein
MIWTDAQAKLYLDGLAIIFNNLDLALASRSGATSPSPALEAQSAIHPMTIASVLIFYEIM